MGLFFPNSIKKRGDVSPVGATAFAFGIVKSPCYEFTHSDFTIPTATGRRYIPAKSIVEIKERSCSKVFTFETASFSQLPGCIVQQSSRKSLNTAPEQVTIFMSFGRKKPSISSY
jgi:hypothetical protein